MTLFLSDRRPRLMWLFQYTEALRASLYQFLLVNRVGWALCEDGHFDLVEVSFPRHCNFGALTCYGWPQEVLDDPFSVLDLVDPFFFSYYFLIFFPVFGIFIIVSVANPKVIRN